MRKLIAFVFATLRNASSCCAFTSAKDARRRMPLIRRVRKIRSRTMAGVTACPTSPAKRADHHLVDPTTPRKAAINSDASYGFCKMAAAFPVRLARTA